MSAPIQVYLPVEHIAAVFTRKLPEGAQQALVCTEQGIHPLLGLDSAAHPSSIHLGPPLPLTERGPNGRTAPYTWSSPANSDNDGAARAPICAVCDTGPVGDGGLCFLSTRDAVLRLDAAGTLELVAGQPGSPGRRDGPGGTSLVQAAVAMTADGSGGVFFSDGGRDCVRRARLAAPPRAAAAAPAPPALAIAVATLPFHIPAGSHVYALSYDYSSSSLYVCTSRMIYRAVGVGEAAAAAAAAGPNRVAPRGLQPVAGREEGDGCVDGAGPTALFGSICGAVVDAHGYLYVTDEEGPNGAAVVRRVDPANGGNVTTLPSATLGDLERAPRLAILPGGWLCAYEWGGSKLWLLQLGLEPSRPRAPAAAVAPAAAAPAAPAAPAAGPDLAGLVEDLGGLLAVPWYSADVVVLVGGTPFPAHSQILMARSEYFRRSLMQSARHSQSGGVGGLTDAGAGGGEAAAAAAAGRRELPLPDADPEAFRSLLRYIYTGELDFPEPLRRPVLALADRLLLPRVVLQVQQQLQLHQWATGAAGTACGSPGGPMPGVAGAPGVLTAGAPGGPTLAPQAPGPAAGSHAPPAAGPPTEWAGAPPSAGAPSEFPPTAGMAPAAAAPPPLGRPPAPGPPGLAATAPTSTSYGPPPLGPDDSAPSAPPGDLGMQHPTSVAQQPQLLRPPVQQPETQAPQVPQAPQAPHAAQPLQAPAPLQAPQPAQASQAPPQLQQYNTFPYPQAQGYGAAAPPPPAFGPPPGVYGTPPQAYTAQAPSPLYGGPPPASQTYGAPPAAPGYGNMQQPAFRAQPPYGPPGPSYTQQPGIYGAPPPVGYGAPPQNSPQGYSLYGGMPQPQAPPPGGAYYPPY